jgi:hypothetical protein
VTTDATPHAVYYVQNGTAYDVEAAPVAGGAPVVIKAGIADADSAYVSGGAVAFYTGTTAGIATSITVWTKANGAKPVTTASRDAVFFASQDGTRVAFSTNATATSTDIAVTTSAAPSAATPALTGANAVNLAATACDANIGFTGTTLVGAYCTGVDTTATQAKLVTVDATGAAVVRINNTAAGDAIRALWFADTSGTKLFVVGPAPDNQGKVVIANGANTTVANADINIAGPIDVAKDGSRVIYRTTGGALQKATFAATPAITPVVASGVLGVLDISQDSKYVAYNTLDASGLTDAKVVDVTAATPAPAVIATAATAAGIQFIGAGTHVIYLDELTNTTGKLKSKPVAGGAEKVLDAASYGAYVPRVGTGVLTVTAIPTVGQNDTDTVSFVDAVAGGALKPAATDILYDPQSPVSIWSGKTLVHMNVSTAAPGIYALSTP